MAKASRKINLIGRWNVVFSYICQGRPEGELQIFDPGSRTWEFRPDGHLIEAKLVNCTLWMTKHEIADLFNVFVSAVGNNFRSIFKSGLLREENVIRIHKYEYTNTNTTVAGMK